VEVDNTPPDVGIILSGLMQDINMDDPGASTLNIFTRLDGHAVDSNLKAGLLNMVRARIRSNGMDSWVAVSS